MASHAELGASSSGRWLSCPASVVRSRGKPNTAGAAAAQGTAAHALGEQCLIEDRDPEEFLGGIIEDHEVTYEMAAAVSTYVHYVRGIMADADDYYIEGGVDLGWLWNGSPPAPLFGTADFIARVGTRLIVVDYKHGRNKVEITSPQLKYYALGALEKYQSKEIHSVMVVICQPNLTDEAAIRTLEFPLDELRAWFLDVLKPGVERALGENPFARAGTHCQFCPAAGECPDLAETSLAMAQSEFDAIHPPAPEILTNMQISKILSHSKLISDWLAAVAGEGVQRAMRDGEAIPGFALGKKRTLKRWTDEAAAEQFFNEQGIDAFKRSLVSPAEAVRRLKAAGIGSEEVEGLIEIPEGDPTLKPVKD